MPGLARKAGDVFPELPYIFWKTIKEIPAQIHAIELIYFINRKYSMLEFLPGHKEL
jgi:hypothetical protein